LFIFEDFADVFGHGVLAQTFALTDAFAVTADCCRLVLEIKPEHFFRFLGGANRLRQDCGRASEIVNFFSDDQRVAEFFAGVLLEVAGNVQVLGAAQYLLINEVEMMARYPPERSSFRRSIKSGQLRHRRSRPTRFRLRA
jgi:hypothetical protein